MKASLFVLLIPITRFVKDEAGITKKGGPRRVFVERYVGHLREVSRNRKSPQVGGLFLFTTASFRHPDS